MGLRWLLDDTVVDESTFQPGKMLALEAFGTVAPPKFMQVFQVYGPAMRQILKFVGIPEQRQRAEFAVVPWSDRLWRADRPWELTTPRGLRLSAAYVFFDDVSEKPSGRVYNSSRVGKARFKGAGGVGEGAGPIPIGVGGSGTLTASIQFAVDPEVSVEVMTGAALVEHTITNLMEDAASRDDPESADVVARVELAIVELRLSLKETYTPPPDWTTFPPPRSLTVVGNTGEVLDTAISLDAPSPGTGYFALQFYDSHRDEARRLTHGQSLSTPI